MIYLSCLIILSVYAFCVLLALIGWLIPNRVPAEWKLKGVPTLIVPFRNEENNLPKLISSIHGQSIHPKVIFVDDHSTDDSISKISLSNFEVILNSGEGKKMASYSGIQAARSELLLFTDADSQLPNEYVKNISENYAYTNFDFFYGPVLNSTPKKSFFKTIFFLDQLALTGIAVGSGRMNVHLFCSGANMGGKKSVLIQASEKLNHSTNLSGDDSTLLSLFSIKNKKVVALTDKKFAITTNGPNTLVEFLKQRLRWGQKTGFNSNLGLIFLSLTVFLSSCTVIFCLISSISDFWNIHWLLLPAGKLLIDLLFLFLVSYRLGVTQKMWCFVPAWIFNILYIPIITLTGFFYSGTWKGRKIRVKEIGK